MDTSILDWTVGPAMLIFAGIVIYVIATKIMKRVSKKVTTTTEQQSTTTEQQSNTTIQ